MSKESVVTAGFIILFHVRQQSLQSSLFPNTTHNHSLQSRQYHIPMLAKKISVASTLGDLG